MRSDGHRLLKGYELSLNPYLRHQWSGSRYLANDVQNSLLQFVEVHYKEQKCAEIHVLEGQAYLGLTE